MKKWVARAMVTTMVTGGALAVAVPAQAGTWVSGGVYTAQSKCISVGKARVASGYYQTYRCEAQQPGWWLRGYVN